MIALCVRLSSLAALIADNAKKFVDEDPGATFAFIRRAKKIF